MAVHFKYFYNNLRSLMHILINNFHILNPSHGVFNKSGEIRYFKTRANHWGGIYVYMILVFQLKQ